MYFELGNPPGPASPEIDQLRRRNPVAKKDKDSHPQLGCGSENIRTGSICCKKAFSTQTEFETLHLRRVVAGNPNTPTQILAKLSADQHSVIRRHVAENPRTPAAVLRKLAQDHDMDVRLAVADNVHTPPDTLALLARDVCVDVRYDLAENRHLPEPVLIELTQDENPYVRIRALKTLRQA